MSSICGAVHRNVQICCSSQPWCIGQRRSATPVSRVRMCVVPSTGEEVKTYYFVPLEQQRGSGDGDCLQSAS